MDLPAVAHKNQVQNKPKLLQAITAIGARREAVQIERILLIESLKQVVQFF